VRVQRHTPTALYPRERAGTHCTGGRVGPRAGMDGRKISTPPEFDLRTVLSVAQSLHRLSYPTHNFSLYGLQLMDGTEISCSCTVSDMIRVKVKGTLVQALRLCKGCTAYRWSRSIALLFHDQRHMKGVRGQRQAPAALYPRQRPGTHCTGGSVI